MAQGAGSESPHGPRLLPTTVFVEVGDDMRLVANLTPERPPEPPDSSDDVKNYVAAVNDAGEKLRVTWVTLLSLVTYLFVAVGSTTHKDLLLEKAQAMPILSIELPLLTFYAWAPVLLIVIHAYYLVQFYLVSLRLRELSNFIRSGGDPGHVSSSDEIKNRNKTAELGLDSGLIVQYLAGRGVSFSGPRAMIALAILSTSVVAPLLLLLAFQITFLPYHSEAMTSWHRVAFLFDLGLLVYMWPKAPRVDIIGPDPLPQAPALGDAFAKSMTTLRKKPGARILAAIAELVTYLAWLGVAVAWLVRRARTNWRRLTLAAITAATAYFSVAVANFPGESAERLGSVSCPAVYSWVYGLPDSRERPAASNACLTAIMFDGPINYGSGNVRSPFARNLVLPGLDLVDATDDEVKKHVAERQYYYSFIGRNLTHAAIIAGDLRGIRFDGSDFSYARLAGTRFRNGSFACVDKNGNGSPIPDEEECARLNFATLGSIGLQPTDFTQADLTRASFVWANLGTAIFTKADLQAAGFMFSEGRPDFGEARLARALFDYARFERPASFAKADLTAASFGWARMEEVSFAKAILGNVDFTGSKESEAFATRFDEAILDGSDFTSATGNPNFTKADLAVAHLDAVTFVPVNLRDANLTSASAGGAILHRADARGAKFTTLVGPVAQLSGNFSGADFDAAQMVGANFDGTFAGSSFGEAVLTGASFESATLRGSDFYCADLQGADLSFGPESSAVSFNGAAVWRSIIPKRSDDRFSSFEAAVVTGLWIDQDVGILPDAATIESRDSGCDWDEFEVGSYLPDKIETLTEAAATLRQDAQKPARPDWVEVHVHEAADRVSALDPSVSARTGWSTTDPSTRNWWTSLAATFQATEAQRKERLCQLLTIACSVRGAGGGEAPAEPRIAAGMIPSSLEGLNHHTVVFKSAILDAAFCPNAVGLSNEDHALLAFMVEILELAPEQVANPALDYRTYANCVPPPDEEDPSGH